jgi:hypothetical protein
MSRTNPPRRTKAPTAPAARPTAIIIKFPSHRIMRTPKDIAREAENHTP